MLSISNYEFLILTEPHHFQLERLNDGMLGIIQNTGTIVSFEGLLLKPKDQIFSINNRNVLGEKTSVIHGLLQGGGKILQIGVLRPKQFDSNKCKSS